MESFTWIELAVADAHVTEMLLDTSNIQSQKILTTESSDNHTKTLIQSLSEKYSEVFSQLNFLTVEYLPSQYFTNLGVFAKEDIEEDSSLLLDGFLSKLPLVLNCLNEQMFVFSGTKAIN